MVRVSQSTNQPSNRAIFFSFEPAIGYRVCIPDTRYTGSSFPWSIVKSWEQTYSTIGEINHYYCNTIHKNGSLRAIPPEGVMVIMLSYMSPTQNCTVVVELCVLRSFCRSCLTEQRLKYTMRGTREEGTFFKQAEQEPRHVQGGNTATCARLIVVAPAAPTKPVNA